MTTLAQAWEVFKSGVASTLRQWTVLRLAIDNNWGGGDSVSKAALMEDELINMFKTKKELYRDEIEDYLNACLDDSFGTYAEDGSPAEVATLLLEMFKRCGALDFELVRVTIQKEEASRAQQSRSIRGAGAFEEDVESDDDGDSDAEMTTEGGDSTAMMEEPPKPKVDADGWETVTPKGKKKGKARAGS